MNDKTLYAISSVVFAVVFLGGILVFGEALSRQVALGSALLAAMSQFVAQDYRAQRWSIGFAYGAFLFALLALIAFCNGA